MKGVPVTMAVDESSNTMAGSATLRLALVVDDSRLQRKIITSLLRKWGLEVIEAASGDEAIVLCDSHQPDLVLSDWMMPGMDGLEFCRRFRQLARDSYGYFILLTSKGEKDEIARGLDAGADDFLTKPVNAAELRARITAGARILQMERELNQKNRVISETLGTLQTLYDAIDKDLKQARKIQDSLMPETVRDFGGSRVSLLLKPCGHVGGDLVGMFSPDDMQLGFYSIDVSGHGITSAMMTARVAGYLNSSFPDQNIAMERDTDGRLKLRPPDVVARMLNDRLNADAGVEEYLTLLYAVVDLRKGVAKLVQAGHPHPLVMRADGSAEFIGCGGVPVGLVNDVIYDQSEIRLAPGDRLLLYSDGFPECVMKNGRMLEDDGLHRLAISTPHTGSGADYLQDMFSRLAEDMAAPGQLTDDVSAALLEFGCPEVNQISAQS